MFLNSNFNILTRVFLDLTLVLLRCVVLVNLDVFLMLLDVLPFFFLFVLFFFILLESFCPFACSSCSSSFCSPSCYSSCLLFFSSRACCPSCPRFLSSSASSFSSCASRYRPCLDLLDHFLLFLCFHEHSKWVHVDRTALTLHIRRNIDRVKTSCEPKIRVAENKTRFQR